MNEAVSCPSCGKRFRFRPELVGKRVTCPDCAGSFVVSAPADEPTLDDGVGASSGAFPPSSVSHRSRQPAPEPSGWDSFRIRMAVGLGAFGIGALVLPLFGLQFRKLGKLSPEGAQAAGISMLVLSGIFFGWGWIRQQTRRAIKYVAIGVAAVVGIAIIIVIVAVVSHGSRSRPTPRPPDPTARPAPPPNTGPRPPGVAERPTASRSTPSPTPGVSPRPGTTPPTGHTPYDGLCKRFGADKVVRLRVTGAERSRARVMSQVHRLFEPSEQRTVILSPPSDVVEVCLAPWEDIEALAARIEFGTVTATDKEQRIISITMNAADTNRPPSRTP